MLETNEAGQKRSDRDWISLYQEYGWPVIPLHNPIKEGKCSCLRAACSSPAKHPRTLKGSKDASFDPSITQKWWKMWPTSNVGIATGSKSKLLVVDVDPRHGGDKSWSAWSYQNEIAETLKCFTGGGGFHLYFSTDKIIKNKVGLLPGVDVRGEDGYVVAPGSYHISGTQYQWASEPSLNSVLPLPSILENLILGNRTNVVSLRNKLIPTGARNNTLTSIAGLLHKHGLDETALRQGLSALNQSVCSTPLEFSEITSIAKSISKYERPELKWGEIKALPKLDLQAPALEASCIPETLRPWMEDISDRMQVPLEFIAAPAIVGLSSVIGRQIGIYPKQKDDWLVVPNLWGSIIARPGFFKSPAIAEALRPLDNLTSKAGREFESGKIVVKAREELLKAKIEGLKDTIKKITRKGNQQDLDPLRRDLEAALQEMEENVISEKRYKTNDATVEKLACLIKENPKGMLVLRDELSGWLKSLQKSGREGDREFYLEAWNGYGSFTVDRIGRGTLHVPALCLSIFGGLQPAKIDAYFSQVLNNHGDDGLLQRFQILVYPDTPKKWRNVDRKPNRAALEGVTKIFDSLSDLKILNHEDEAKLPGLRFSSYAQHLFDAWRSKLESRLRSDDRESPVFESHLAKFRSLVPSLALIFHLIGRSSATVDVQEQIQADSILLAIRWSEFLEAHARKVYVDVLYPNLKATQILGDKIALEQVRDGDTLRSIYRRQWFLLRTPSELEPVLSIMEDCGWIKIETVKVEHKTKEVIRINPSLGSSELLEQFR